MWQGNVCAFNEGERGIYGWHQLSEQHEAIWTREVLTMCREREEKRLQNDMKIHVMVVSVHKPYLGPRSA